VNDGAADSRRLEHDRFRLLAEHAPVMLWLAGPDAKCLQVNRAWLDFTGRALEAESGPGWMERVHRDDADRFLGAYAAAARERRGFDAAVRLRRHDGAYRRMVLRGVPLARDGQLSGFAGACDDITDRTNSDERSAEFLANVAHELRTPLNSIKSWAHVLENLLREADPSARRALAGIMIGVEHQARLIDDLLDVTRPVAARRTDT
jgi:PAS domain S-box-containing protein